MLLRRCSKCGRYSLSEECCGILTKNPHPPKFSITDKYGKYRRLAKNFKNKDDK